MSQPYAGGVTRMGTTTGSAQRLRIGRDPARRGVAYLDGRTQTTGRLSKNFATYRYYPRYVDVEV